MINNKHLFPAHSALFHVVDDLIFVRDNLAYKVNTIMGDSNDINLEIRDEKRLKNILFKTILKNYNQRINGYDLLLTPLSNSDLKNFELLRYKLVINQNMDNSGYYTVYPKTFICIKCGHIKNFSNNDDWEKFNPKKCENSFCNGKYKQATVVRFCEKCGLIDPISFYCKDHGKEHFRLIRKEKDIPNTWEVECTECRKTGKKPIPYRRFQCYHKDYGNILSNEPPYNYKSLIIMEGSISNSCVITTVDVPKTKYNALEGYLDYILLGLYLKRFDTLFKDILPDGNIDLQKIDLYFKLKNDPNLQDLIDSGMVNSKLTNVMEKLSNEIEKMKLEFDDFPLENINDYLLIKGVFSEDSSNILPYQQYLESIEDIYKKNQIIENYEYLKDEFSIDNVTYISDIRLISSAIGIIKGMNKFYQHGFVPHFEPIWKNKKNQDSFRAYAYPFETEGIIFDLNKVKVVNWLINNGFITNQKVNNESDALKILLKINQSSVAYEKLRILLHTLSHILIKRSSLYTGLESDSCGELLFVNSAAFLIYSTSNINIGGFSFVFENSIFDWFKDVKLDVKDCVFDPSCIHETGSCFSCLFLPEFVCSEFNQYLDRDVLIGKNRYKSGFW